MDIPGDMSKASFNAPTQVVEVDATAMAATPADIRDLPASYAFVVDMPGLEPGEIKVQVEYGNLLVISGEGRQEDDDEGKYLHMERQVRKFMCKFLLSHNANTDAISAVCWNGVLTVTVEKLPSSPPPPPPKTIEVKFA